MKHWILYILATVGITALVLWLYNRFGRTKTPPIGREPVVSVTTDDPNMIVDFGGKPDWNSVDVDMVFGTPLPRSLTTTYVKR